MAIRIITDSASDLTTDIIKENNIRVVPLSVTFGDTEYKSGVDLSADDFYEKLIESDSLPITSQVPPYQWEKEFKAILNEGDTPLAITLSSHLSGTYQSAFSAAKELEGKVYVVDSMNVSLGQSILIMYALRLIEEGLSIQEIVEKLEERKNSISVLALLDTLEYLKKGGRISAVAAAMGGILCLKPVVSVEDGEVKAVGSARGSKSGNNLLKQLVAKDGGINFEMPVFLAYSGLDQTMLDKYIKDSSDLWKDKTEGLSILRIGPTVGTHVGPGAIAVAYFSDNK